MSNSLDNLEKLTDQIYKEGIEKAEAQSKKMIQEAEAEKALILKNAKAEAEKILEEAERESRRLKLSVESELELKAKQFTSDFKLKIQNLLAQKIVDHTTKEALADVSFMQTIIADVLKHWKNSDEVELILPKKLEGKINGAFKRRIHEVAPNMIIHFESNPNDGFRIARKEDHYQISFSDDDFIEIFKSYLSEQTKKVLFKSAE
jgi:V/A-type H+-transporting ATPase subunit E